MKILRYQKLQEGEKGREGGRERETDRGFLKESPLDSLDPLKLTVPEMNSVAS